MIGYGSTLIIAHEEIHFYFCSFGPVKWLQKLFIYFFYTPSNILPTLVTLSWKIPLNFYLKRLFIVQTCAIYLCLLFSRDLLEMIKYATFLTAASGTGSVSHHSHCASKRWHMQRRFIYVPAVRYRPSTDLRTMTSSPRKPVSATGPTTDWLNLLAFLSETL